jgi:type I restriction-modification system DNA methylase subunit
MPLFQNSVVTKYLQAQNRENVFAQWNAFTNYFQNPEIQQNIREAKEEQFQEGFLRELFVKILGYTLNPQPQYNLTTEYKNIKDSKKVDGAIIINEIVKAVIELKATNTSDLGKVETQAFGYKNNQPDCVYVITSNFEKLRFYIDNAIEHIEFNLFTLSEKEFEMLWLCLAYENIEKEIPKKIKDESVGQEDEITKQLYKDYSLFKRELHQNLVALNPGYEPLELFKKSQKLLDRFLFLFFAEDRLLLPPNSVKLVLNDWKDLQDRDVDISLYDRFKKYFGYLNTGFKGKRYDVYAYNGGLFKPDEILDSLKIDNDLLYRHTLKLSEYDFVSEVDVNILGHIFENSLNELDEIKAQLEGKEIDKSKTKRKKDGVFYTPKYITKYIVDNTVGKLCIEKKAGLQINEEDYSTDRRMQLKTKQALVDKLTEYRSWLLQLTICDPACGSGAFLNQALDFLIREHKYIDELQAKLFGDALVLSDIENSILENNLFGVDLNEESVEIAKLSLWLRTAQPNRKLNDLNNNIKCGNSLIDDPAVAGDKAFNWFEEFPQVFKHYRKPKVETGKEESGLDDREYLDEVYEPSYSYKSGSKGFEKYGFDVVIGNPPYAGRSSTFNNAIKHYVRENYETYEGKFELYQLFIEKCLFITKRKKSFISLITPQTWLSIIQATKLRALVLKNSELNDIVFLGKNVFEDASVDTIIFTISIGKKNNVIRYLQTDHLLSQNEVINSISYTSIDKNSLIIPLNSNNITIDLIGKISTNCITLDQIGIWSDGVKIVGKAKDFAFQNIMIDNTFHPMYIGKDIIKYYDYWGGLYCCRNKKEIERHNASDIRLRDEIMFKRNKILIRKTGNEIIATIDKSGKYYEQSLFSFGVNEETKITIEFLLVILNSSTANFLLKANAFSKKDTFPQIRIHWLKEFPIKNIPLSDQQPFIEKADLMLSLNKELQEASQKLQRTLQRRFEINDLPKKLEEWYLLSYGEFIKELGKKKIELSLSDEAEWEAYFTQEAAKALELKSKIEDTDKEIDRMVYELYGLTEEEIRIVEEG